MALITKTRNILVLRRTIWEQDDISELRAKQTSLISVILFYMYNLLHRYVVVMSSIRAELFFVVGQWSYDKCSDYKFTTSRIYKLQPWIHHNIFAFLLRHILNVKHKFYINVIKRRNCLLKVHCFNLCPSQAKSNQNRSMIYQCLWRMKARRICIRT